MNLVGLLMNTTDTGKRLGAQVKEMSSGEISIIQWISWLL